MLMTNCFGVLLNPQDVRWAAAERVSETVIAAVLLLHERCVDEIAPKQPPAECQGRGCCLSAQAATSASPEARQGTPERLKRLNAAPKPHGFHAAGGASTSAKPGRSTSGFTGWEIRSENIPAS